MELRIINYEKGYLWPTDILCEECEGNIHLATKDQLRKVTNGKTGEFKYFVICKCGEPHLIPAERIPEEIRDYL